MTPVLAVLVVLTGSLTGHDGRPLPRGDVHLVLPGSDQPVTSVTTARDGTFTLRTDRTGLAFAHFTGVDHVRRKVVLLLGRSDAIAIDVRLRANDYRTSFDKVTVIGDFNKFSRDNARPMQRAADGTFTAEVPAGAATLAYQLLGITEGGASVNGTQSDSFAYDGGGDYHSVIRTSGGVARIVFDPRRLPRSQQPGMLKFAAPGGFDARFAKIHDDMLARREKVPAARRVHKAAGKTPHTFIYDWSKDVQELTRAVEAEKNRVLRQVLLVSYLDLGVTADGARLSTRMAERALAEIEPTSMLWSLDPALLPTALRYSKSEARHAAYVRQVLEGHPDASLRKILTKTISPARRIMAGKPVPAFRVSSFDDPAVIYTPASLRGKVYIIDFWATWCAPCLDELPNMNQMYAQYKAGGFEILSLSLDSDRETVNKFRRAGWKMPWMNSILEGGTSHPLLKDFEIAGIPRAILVGRDGVILATDGDLRGRNLARTLARVLEK